MERVEHLFEGLPALYTILTLLPTVAVTGTTVSHGWKTNVATLDDLVNLTLSLPSIPFFFFFLLAFLLGPLVGKLHVNGKSRCALCNSLLYGDLL